MSAWIVSKRHIDFLVSAALASFGPDSDERTSFFKAIDENPTDEATRAVFADWAEENSQPKLAARLRDGLAASPNMIGRMLWRENLVSVATRYPSDGDGERPGPNSFRDSDVDTYTWTPAPVLIGAALYKTVGCYGYQSCEHGELWHASYAKALVSELCPERANGNRDKSLSNDPAYELTPWGWDDGNSKEEAAIIKGLTAMGCVATSPKQRKPRKPTVKTTAELDALFQKTPAATSEADELADALFQIDALRSELDDARRQIDDLKAELEAAKAQPVNEMTAADFLAARRRKIA